MDVPDGAFARRLRGINDLSVETARLPPESDPLGQADGWEAVPAPWPGGWIPVVHARTRGMRVAIAVVCHSSFRGQAH